MDWAPESSAAVKATDRRQSPSVVFSRQLSFIAPPCEYRFVSRKSSYLLMMLRGNLPLSPRSARRCTARCSLTRAPSTYVEKYICLYFSTSVHP